MNTRRTIDLAIGVVMERAQCSADVAFATLKQQSQHTNTPVTAVARTVRVRLRRPGGAAAPFDRRTAEPRNPRNRRATVEEKYLRHIECDQRFRGQPLPERPPRS